MTTKKLIAFVLAFVMVFSLMAIPGMAYDTGDAGTVSANRADLAIVYLGKTAPYEYPETLAAQEIPKNFSLTYDSEVGSSETLWVGVQVSNMSAVADLVGASGKGTAEGGIYAYQFTIAYDDTFLRCGIDGGNTYLAAEVQTFLQQNSPAFTTITKSKGKETQINNAYVFDTDNLKELDVTADASSEANKVQNPKYFRMPVKMDSSVLTAANVATQSRMFHNNQGESISVNTSLSDQPFILAVFPLVLKDSAEWPETVSSPIVQLTLDQTSFNMNFGYSNSSDASWKTNQNGASPEKNLKNYFDIVDKDGKHSDGTLPLVSVPAPALTDITFDLSKSAVTLNGSTDSITIQNPKAVPDGAELGTVTYSVTDSEGVSATAKGVTVSGTTISIAKKATEGTYTVTATSVSGENTVTSKTPKTFTITRTPPTANAVTVNPTSATVTLNADGTAPADVAATVAVTDQYGDAMSGGFTITPSGVPTGASWADNKFTFTNALRAGKSTVKFTVGSKSANFTLTVNKAAAPAAPTVGKTDVTTLGGNNGTITGVDNTMQYKLKTASDWTDITGTTVTGLTAGTYQVRVKETDFANAGAVAEVTIGEPGRTPTPNVSIAASSTNIPEDGSVTLTATVTPATGTITYKWYKDNVEISGENSATLTATEIGVYKCEVTRKDGSDAVSAPATSNEITLTQTVKTVVTVTAKTSVTVTAGATLAIGDVVDVDPAAAKNLVTGTVTVYEKVVTPGKDEVIGVPCDCSKSSEPDPEAVEHDEGCHYVKAEAAVPETTEYNLVTTPLEAGKEYFATYSVNAVDNDETYKVEAVVAKGVPTKVTESEYIKVTVNAPSTGGGVSGITVRYDVGEHGTLKGSASESVQRGKTPSKVPTVTAKEGYKFLGWSLDGKTVVDPTTVTITSSTTFTALYQSVKNTYISGYPDGTFRPDAQVSRAEIASMLARLSKDFDADKTYDGTASDVDANAWYSDFVNFGMNKGFISGYKDGTFQPDGKITRGEFASMLARYMGLTEGGSKQFTDTADHWAGNSIAVLADAGIVTGYNDGSFKPNANLTRAEAVQMINTALKVQALTGAADIVPTDVTSAHWAYNQILAAMNTDIKDIVK